MALLTCDRCHYPIPADAPSGVCPRCLLATAGQIPMPVNQSPEGQSPTRFPNTGEYERSESLPSLELQPTLDAKSALPPNQSLPSIEILNQRFDDLEVLERIGQGGMGAVFKARQSRLDRIVALKIISPELSQNPAFVERFSREAKTMARLAHRNIITIFDFGIRGSDCYLLMEYVDGINLRQAIRGKTISAPQALDAVRQICDALQYAHDKGIVHRDIKPENILIDSRGHVKIADFGLAKLIHSDAVEVSLTGTNQVLGTRNYMAPEQIEKPETVDHRADIYSLGVVFYELLTGELPIGRFANPSEKSQLNQALDQVVLKTLEKEPIRRYQQASEISVAMQAVPAMVASAAPQPNAPDRRADEHSAVDKKPAPLPHYPVNHPSISQPEDIFCPFKIDHVYEGFAKAHGLARVNSQGVELELDVRDDVFQVIKSKPIRVQIPFSAIHSARLENTFWGNATVFIQAKTLEAVSKVPNAKQGLIKLSIDKADREMGTQMVSAIQEFRAGGSAASADHSVHQKFTTTNDIPMSPPVAPVKSQLVTESNLIPVGHRRAALNKVSGPSRLLSVLGIIVMVITGLRVLKGMGQINVNSSLVPMPSHIFQSALEALIVLQESIVPLGLGGLMIIAAQNMKKLKNRWLGILGCVAAMLPFYSFYTLGFFLGIWGLVVLLNPDVKREFDSLDGEEDENDLAHGNTHPRNSNRFGMGEFSSPKFNPPVTPGVTSAQQHAAGNERKAGRTWLGRWATSLIAVLILAVIAIPLLGGLILLALLPLSTSNFEFNRGDKVTTIESNGTQITIERGGRPSVKIQNKRPDSEIDSADSTELPSELLPKPSLPLEDSMGSANQQNAQQNAID